MRPIKPRGPAGGGMPVGPAVNVLPTRGGPAGGGMPVGPAVNVLPSKPAPAIGGGGPANPAPMPGPAVNRLPPSPAYGGTGIPAYGANIPPYKTNPMGMKKGGKVKSSASKRADGIAQRGKTKGKFV